MTRVESLHEVEVERAVALGRVLGVGENIGIGVCLATGERSTVLLYGDHDIGTLVKDGFLIPESVEHLVESLDRAAERADRADLTTSELTPAEARGRIAEAGEMAAMTVPTTTAPRCSGTSTPRPTPLSSVPSIARTWCPSCPSWSTSPTDHCTGDPLRWSPVSVAMLLGWLPHKVIAEEGCLALASDLPRAYVSYCHDVRGIRPWRLIHAAGIGGSGPGSVALGSPCVLESCRRRQLIEQRDAHLEVDH